MVAVLAVAAISTVPVLAAPTGTKYYKYEVTSSPSPVQAGQAATFTVTIRNTSPKQSSSNISSVAVVVPAQFAISSAAISTESTNGDNSGATVVINPADSGDCVTGTGQQVSACGIAPVKSQKKVVLSITATATSDVACGTTVASDAWLARASTGSQLNGNDFDPDPTQPATTTTSITKTCNGEISGQLWRDHDVDGTRDADEEGQNGWVVKVFAGTDLVATDTTATEGTETEAVEGVYSFTGLEVGSTYTVCEFAPAEGSGFEYRGWIQSVPAANTLCSGFTGAEPTGYSVSLTSGSPSASARDFFNARTITVPEDAVAVKCDEDLFPEGVTEADFTVGDGETEPEATVTFSQDACKPGEYIFESWILATGDQQVSFYPTFPKTGTLVPITQVVDWVIDDDKSQRDLWYDDDVAGVPERKVLFCEVDASGDFFDMPDPVAPDDDPHTTCLMSTSEMATPSGVGRHDVIVTIVDGKTFVRGT
ncbi:MAG: SdrD B-like domain-containing protein [Actinomycetota bacterium]